MIVYENRKNFGRKWNKCNLSEPINSVQQDDKLDNIHDSSIRIKTLKTTRAHPQATLRKYGNALNMVRGFGNNSQF